MAGGPKRAGDSSTRIRDGKCHYRYDSQMLAPGNRAPDFTAPDQNNEPISLSRLLKSGPLILYFYPADFTPGCTRRRARCATCTRSCSRPG